MYCSEKCLERSRILFNEEHVAVTILTFSSSSDALGMSVVFAEIQKSLL